MAVQQKKQILALAIAASDKLLMDILFNMEREDSDSDNSDDEQIQLELRRRINVRDQQIKPCRIEGYVEEIIPRLSHNQFREHFRMLPETYELLEQRLAIFLSNQNDGRPKVSVRKQLLATLWLLATPDSYR